MVASLTYRTTDATRWGGGIGTDLSAVQIDLNFWTLFSSLQALEDHQEVNAGIDFINQPAGGNLFYIHLTNHQVLGPFVIPTSQWNPRGNWAPLTAYAPYDVVSENGSVYLITIGHTSAATFSAFATDGDGHLLYNLILEQPTNQLPTDGTPGQRLAKAPGSPFDTEWISDRVRMSVFVPGVASSGQLLLQYCVTDLMTLPAGLAGSVFFSAIHPAANATYVVNLNGAAVATITFTGPSPVDLVVSCPSDVDCVPGDIITLTAPAPADVVQSNISFTIVALLTL